MKRPYIIFLGVVALIVLLSLSLELSQWLPGRVGGVKPAIGATFVVEASAYSPSPYQTDGTPCITAVGTRVRRGVIATNFLPMGTIISINDALYIVEDRMNSRYQNGYIDIWFPSTKEALAFGRARVKIKIEDYGTPGQALAREADSQQVVQPSVLERMNLRFTAYGDIFSNTLQAAVTGKKDINCSETQ
jgi:3D (Asp-Asp-Asp) domain-containing protein